MKFIYVLLSVVFLFSFSGCNNIDEKDLQGKWIYWKVTRENRPINYEELIFKQDSVALTDDYSFKQKASYQLVNNDVLIAFEHKRHYKMGIQSLQEDTLVLNDGTKYLREKTSDKEFDFKVFPLINIETNQLLDKNNRQSSVFYYKSPKGERVIRTSHAFIKFDDLPLFFNGHDRREKIEREVIVFVGKGINLIDLKMLYYPLKNADFNKTILALSENGFSGYEIFKDRIDVWNEDYLPFLKEHSPLPLPPLPPPPPYDESRKSFLGKTGMSIRVNSEADFKQLLDLNPEKKYVVLINNEMDLKTYLDLKSLVQKLCFNKQITIKTEIL